MTSALGLLLLAPTVALGQPAPDAEAPVVGDSPPDSGMVAPVDPPPAADPPAIADASVTAPALVGYKKGFFIESDDKAFKLVIQGRVQGRFQLENEDPGGGADRETGSAFSVPRARLSLKGHAFTKNVKYKFQTDFGKGFASLKDFFVDYKMGGPVVRFGQFKRPFSRQQISSSGRLELVDRAITDKAFGAGRDIGVMVHNNYEKSPELEWAFGVFNGSGDKPVFSGTADPMTGDIDGGFSNVPGDVQPALVARFGYNDGGVKGYRETDFARGPLRFAVGGSVLAAFDNDNDDASGIAGEVDAIVKTGGLSASAGVYVASAQDGTGFADQAYAAFGLHGQVGYLLDDNLQPAVRYAVVAPDGGDATHEITGGFSFYKFKHGLKWQSDISLLGTTPGDEVRARTQLQLSF